MPSLVVGEVLQDAQSVQVGHVQVQHEEVGVKLGDQRDGFAPGGGLSDDAQVLGGSQ